ncbi:hypothetical protein BDD43_0870 [Mucilaginibacter gracilis]|uniref:SnoaL-like domain-containing protein n=1 Tax=Mucilaginibacter gracilis TaxID=423350 RepID=A0A495IVF0_9SPHI|nr:nuclear transport factor 2 family protein [Mucilaginibacter gracilis]RKR80737.1 hypothetical protein BDD43_0870 [Mucilaginibacter gracilis]
MKNISEVVEKLRVALETRNYESYVDCFAEDGVLELPFAVQNSPSRFEGIDNIRERFGEKSQLHSVNKLFELYKVNAVAHQRIDPNTVIVEFDIAGKNIATGDVFSLSSSIAVIRFKEGKIVNHRDYPNTMGLSGAIGLLPQLAASLTR